MKKLFITLILFIVVFSLTAQTQKFKIKEKYEKAYVYKEQSLLVSKSEFDCSFFISEKIEQDIIIVGAKQRWLGKTFYTNENEMYINKGSKDGIKEGDKFSVLEKGKKVGSFGIYYGMKSIAVVTCVYENKATVKLTDGCAPVYIGDFLIKYKPHKPIFKKRIDYKNCRLIKSEINGKVIYHKKSIPLESRTLLGEDLMVAVDIGNAFLKSGDFLLFYKIFSKKLPPLIVGTGIVVSAQKTNSTVKILKLSNPVQIGDRVTYLPEIKNNKLKTNERLPEIGKKGNEFIVKEDYKVFNVNILFNLGEETISESNKTEINRIEDFIKDKNQYTVVLKGFTCNIGKVEDNLKLSKKRVEAVKKYIVDKLGIESFLVESYFYGEKSCEFDNSTEESRRKNRRVLITIIGR
jgi:outer membrane protein OmpA-like peptidoglycan-associated protein